MAVPGNLRLGILTGCGFFFDVPFTQDGTRGVGLPGGPVTVVQSGNVFSLQGGPWTLGTVSVATSNGTPTRQGFAHGPLSGTSSTALPGGELQLVTPVALSLGAASLPTILALFGALTVRFAPEPATGLALALGARRRRVR